MMNNDIFTATYSPGSDPLIPVFGSWFGEKTDPALVKSFERKTAGKPDATMKARYVWLPFTFKGGVPTLEWRDEWKPSDFE